MKFIIFILVLLPGLFFCDLPVHCIARNIVGAWVFHMMEPFPLDSDPVLYRCGHGQPDRNTDHIYHNFKSDFKESVKGMIFLDLKMPNIVFNDKNENIGNWTMIYDEGWEVRFDDYALLAFSYYAKEDLGEPHDDDDEQTKGYVSYCNHTFLGWFTKGKQKGCFYAEKVGQTNNELMKMEKGGGRMEEGREGRTQEGGGIKEERSGKMKEEGGRMKNDEKIKASKIVERPLNFLNKESDKKKEGSDRKEEEQRKEGEGGISITEKRKEEEEMNKKKDREEDVNVVKKFKEKLREYGLPNEYLMAEEQNEDDFFQFDYNFIEMVNEFRESSLWEAKAHEDFRNKTKKQMKNLIGLTPFIEFKFINLKTDNNQENDIDFPYEDPKSFLQIQNKQKLFNKKGSLLFKNKGENSIFTYEEGKIEGKIDPLKDLPKSFDWRNINNINFDTPIEHQGECGSCYAVATLSVLESRIRIKSNNRLQPKLSLSSALDSPFYNQGCNGGYPELLAKHAKEFGLPEEKLSSSPSSSSFSSSLLSSSSVSSPSSPSSPSSSSSSSSSSPSSSSFPSSSSTSFSQSSSTSSSASSSSSSSSSSSFLLPSSSALSSLWFAKDYGYVGRRYYGGCSEEAMMREISERGPIVVAINAAPDLYYYSKGIFVNDGVKTITQDSSHPLLRPWIFTNHAVVCVGWGEEKKNGSLIKFWILKNSWGPEWGEGGYFRMLRGVNLGAVENQAVFIEPEMEGKGVDR